MKLAIAFSAGAQWLATRGDNGRLVRLVDGFNALTGWLLCFVAALLGWQTVLLLALVGEFIDLGTYAAIHFLGSLVWAAWPAWRLNAGVDDGRYATALQIVAWAAFAGPFGAVVALALAVPSAPLRPKAVPDADTDSPPSDRPGIRGVEGMHVALLDRRIRIEGACRINPLMDVIAEGAQAEKLEALGVIYRRYEARLSVVLKRAMQDSDASVRVLAATVIAKLHGTYTRKIGDCQAAAALQPALAQNWRELAEARIGYAGSGLLDAPRARVQIESAVDDLSRAVELDPADLELAGRLEMARRRLRGEDEVAPATDGRPPGATN
jgi:hypothetical protein